MSVGGTGDCRSPGGVVLTTGGGPVGRGVSPAPGGEFRTTGAACSATGAGATAASARIEGAAPPRAAPAFGAPAPPPPQAERIRVNPAAAAIPGSPPRPGEGRRTDPAGREAGESSFCLRESYISSSSFRENQKHRRRPSFPAPPGRASSHAPVFEEWLNAKKILIRGPRRRRRFRLPYQNGPGSGKVATKPPFIVPNTSKMPPTVFAIFFVVVP